MPPPSPKTPDSDEDHDPDSHAARGSARALSLRQTRIAALAPQGPHHHGRARRAPRCRRARVDPLQGQRQRRRRRSPARCSARRRRRGRRSGGLGGRPRGQRPRRRRDRLPVGDAPVDRRGRAGAVPHLRDGPPARLGQRGGGGHRPDRPRDDAEHRRADDARRGPDDQPRPPHDGRLRSERPRPRGRQPQDRRLGRGALRRRRGRPRPGGAAAPRALQPPARLDAGGVPPRPPQPRAHGQRRRPRR